MRRHPIRRSPALWLALLAALLTALSPLAASADSSTLALPMDLCSAAPPDGAIDIPAPGVPAGHATHLPHCAFCPPGGFSPPALHAGTDVLAVLLVADRTAFVPREVSRTQKSPYLPSRPRGPPATLHS